MTRNSISIDSEKWNTFPPRKKSVSILLGAGFSAPKGYPIGNDMNNGLLNFDDSKIDFAPSGEMSISTDGSRPQFYMGGILNPHQKYFTFCKRLIKEYTIAHNNKFDYEEFYDFIKTDEIKQKRYQRLCDDLLTEYESFNSYLSNVSNIYNQMAGHLLHDIDGKSWYDDEPFKVNNVEGYNGFLRFLSLLSDNYIVNVHTLNHDLLFESFNKTGFINGKISDGFDEYGSEYYGKLTLNNRTYHCRLERYTGRYNTPVRLYKLHGSLDYVPYYRIGKDGLMKPEKYVKIKQGIGASEIIKSRKTKIGYDISPFAYHSDFLTGTTSKVRRYNEPLLFRKLFKKFKTNLQHAEVLIIIGYGCKDEGINDFIRDFFNYEDKPSFIVDLYAGANVENFGNRIKAKIIKSQINDIHESLFR